jgi:hypothetical protein
MYAIGIFHDARRKAALIAGVPLSRCLDRLTDGKRILVLAAAEIMTSALNS